MPDSFIVDFARLYRYRGIEKTVELWLMAPLSDLVSILAGAYFYLYVKKQGSGTEKMQEISSTIREGAGVFIKGNTQHWQYL